jgi:glycosyltransferase involved in cell wall biosynthesis
MCGRVHLLGEQTDMAACHLAVDVQVCASDFEGVPNVLIEAMACGVPCIATAVGGVPGLLEDRGALVAPGQTDELGQAIQNLLDDPDTRQVLADRAFEWVRSNHGLDQVGQQFAFRLSCLTK